MIAFAPGKLILCGEHAVVYGQPAIAVPLHSLRATATITAQPDDTIHFDASDLDEHWTLHDQPDQPLSRLLVNTLSTINQRSDDGLSIVLHSTIPVASGLGSGAALGAALVRAVALHYQHPLSPADVSALVYESERFYHGTPSGIDNTVVSYEQPIWFQRTATAPIITPLQFGASITLVVGDTGVRCPTRITVGHVREQRQAQPERINPILAEIGQLVGQVRDNLAAGVVAAVGPLLDHNHTLLTQLGVSAPELERLVTAARDAGAWGAKLSGGGGGGVMLALVDPAHADAVSAALTKAGAVRVWKTVV